MRRENPGYRPGMRVWRTLAGGALLACAVAAEGAAAQSLLDRPPNLTGTWVGESGVVHFNFMHRFSVSDPPARKVTNTPTFLLAAGLPGRTMLGARYATSSGLVAGVPNEWEFFGRYAPLSQAAGGPLDLTLHGAYNHAAESWDGELALARSVGALRLIGAVRGFTDFARSDESRWAVAGGATLRVHRWVALAGDVAARNERTEAEEVAWGAGIHVQIPYTPHTLSLHVSNTATTTLQGASVGSQDERFGFEFTVPITLSRYFGSRGGQAEPVTAPPSGDAEAVEVTMTNRLTFEPRTLRIRPGQTVVWRNTSDVIHTVTADPSRAARRENVALPDGAQTFDSGDMPPGAVFRHTFTVAGEYRYICVPHELAGMVGTIVVGN